MPELLERCDPMAPSRARLPRARVAWGACGRGQPSPPPLPLSRHAPLTPVQHTAHARNPGRQWHYFFLTDTGIAYLKEYLHLPEDVVPATLRKGADSQQVEGVRGPFGDARGERRPFGDRPPRAAGGADTYRRPAAAGAQ